MNDLASPSVLAQSRPSQNEADSFSVQEHVMRHLYFSAVTAALWTAFAIPGRLSAQSATPAQTVSCKDGTSAQKGQGACSHHGGVVRMVSCKDGSTAKKGRGACSHHGGVATRAPVRANSNQTKSGVT